MSPSSSATTVLVVDNHDSFVFTLVGYLTQLGAEVSVVEADDIVDPVDAIRGVDAVMISPGPGTPEAAGASIDIVRAAAAAQTPLLGVCLGHQAIAAAFGAVVSRAPEPMHGRASTLLTDNGGIFVDRQPGGLVGRYHSLAVDESTLPADLHVSARSDDGIVMGIRHRTLPIDGVQFHPESVLTDGGYTMLGRWLDGVRADGVQRAAELGAILDERSVLGR